MALAELSESPIDHKRHRDAVRHIIQRARQQKNRPQHDHQQSVIDRQVSGEVLLCQCPFSERQACANQQSTQACIHNKNVTNPAPHAGNGIVPPDDHYAQRQHRRRDKTGGLYLPHRGRLQRNAQFQRNILSQTRTIRDQDAGCKQKARTAVCSTRTPDQHQQQRSQRCSNRKPVSLPDQFGC